MLECLKCTPAHIAQLKPRLREADRIELTLATGKPPEDVLEEAFNISTESYVWVEDGVVLCVFGVTTHPLNDDVGFPWLMASDEAERKGKRLVRHCAAKIAELGEPYLCLTNFVHAENAVAIRWLKWCRFSMCPPAPYGAEGAKFRQFFKYTGVRNV